MKYINNTNRLIMMPNDDCYEAVDSLQRTEFDQENLQIPVSNTVTIFGGKRDIP